MEGGFNGIAIQIGLAEKFYWDFAGEVPLILKLNGKTDIPSDARGAVARCTPASPTRCGSGADAVGYTLYVGTPAQEADFAQLRQVRADAHALRHAADRLGLSARRRPSRPRAARTPSTRWTTRPGPPASSAPTSSRSTSRIRRSGPGYRPAYDAEFSSQQAVDAVVRSANRTLVLVSGGEKAGDEAMLEKARQSMEAGATGLIFGRNVWQRDARRVAAVRRRSCGTSSPSTRSA